MKLNCIIEYFHFLFKSYLRPVCGKNNRDYSLDKSNALKLIRKGDVMRKTRTFALLVL